MAALPKDSVKQFEDIYSFVYKNGRDLSGFIDGTVLVMALYSFYNTVPVAFILNTHFIENYMYSFFLCLVNLWDATFINMCYL